MNILILAAGATKFNSHDGEYPLCLTELDGIPLIEHIVGSCSAIENANHIFALRDYDIQHYHVDNIVALLAPKGIVLSVGSKSQGAACTALLAKEYINNDDGLLIVNGNELLDVNYAEIVNDFLTRELDAGCVCFSSVHPRYSYVRLDKEGLVVEAAEKKPISRNATAGFYWFKKGKNFVESAQSMIRKDAVVDGLFYICPVFNELVLLQARIGIYLIDAAEYHPLKTERQLQSFENEIGKR